MCPYESVGEWGKLMVVSISMVRVCVWCVNGSGRFLTLNLHGWCA